MKKLLLIFSINLLIGFSTFAQQEVAIAKTYLNQNAAKQNLAASDIAEMTISSQYLSPSTGWYHIYFTQTYQSIEVYNRALTDAEIQAIYNAEKP